MAVADHLAMALLISKVAVGLDPLRHFRFDRRREHLLRSRSKNFAEDISR